MSLQQVLLTPVPYESGWAEHGLRKNLAVLDTSKELVKQIKRNIKLCPSLQEKNLRKMKYREPLASALLLSRPRIVEMTHKLEN